MKQLEYLNSQYRSWRLLEFQFYLNILAPRFNSMSLEWRGSCCQITALIGEDYKRLLSSIICASLLQ